MPRTNESAQSRVLALDPCPVGLGWALLDGRRGLRACGLRRLPRGVRTPRARLQLAAELCDRYRPQMLVLEDWRAPSARRSAPVRRLLGHLCRLARRRRILARGVSRRRLLAAFAARDKREVARLLAARFPTLARRLPPVRECWMGEEPRLAPFDALAFGLTALGLADRLRPALRARVKRRCARERHSHRLAGRQRRWWRCAVAWALQSACPPRA